MRHFCLNLIATITIAVVAPALAGRADAQTLSSSYTSTADKDCRGATTGQVSSASVCPGNAGLIVLVTEDDLRQAVSVGRNRKAAESEPSATQGFGPFNSTTPTVEWRAVDGKPFAIIQRWHIADNDDPDR